MTLLAWLCLGCLLLSSFSCDITPPKKTSDPRVHQAKDIAANAEQIRLRMRGLVQPMSGDIIAAANQIMAATTDRAIQREALLWKINAVPALREALFQSNPITAIADTWAFTFQMTDYFAQGPGAKALGESRGIAVTTSQRLESEMTLVAASITVSGDISKAREYIRKWTTDHPIKYTIAGRESVLSHVAESELAATFSTTEAIGSLVVSMDDLNRRLEIYSAQLLDQSRWQAELLTMDLAHEYQIDKALPLAERAVKSTDRAIETLDRTSPALERSLAVLEKTPALIAAEREATIKALVEEVTRATTFAQGERVAALKQLTTERLATERDMDDILTQQRKLLTEHVDTIAFKAVDYAFLRAMQLCAAVLVAAFLGLLLLLLIAKRIFLHP